MSSAETMDDTAAATPSASSPVKALDQDEGDRNPVFTHLIGGDGDVVGLVAYSIYKQNKHDWLLAFSKAKGREPDEAEMAAYIIGEATPRRLATYRLLAQTTLEGKGPDVHVGVDRGSAWTAPAADKQAGPLTRASGYILCAALVFALTLVAVHFGMLSSR